MINDHVWYHWLLAHCSDFFVQQCHAASHSQGILVRHYISFPISINSPTPLLRFVVDLLYNEMNESTTNSKFVVQLSWIWYTTCCIYTAIVLQQIHKKIELMEFGFVSVAWGLLHIGFLIACIGLPLFLGSCDLKSHRIRAILCGYE